VILIVGVLVIGIAAALLARTLAAAQSIDKKAQTIAVNTNKINVATDSVIELNRTNELASSILSSTKPLQGLLNTIDATARDIAGLAKSINTTAGTIKATAGTDQRQGNHDQQYRDRHQQQCLDDQRHQAEHGITGSEILCTG
jgi:type II secretory pathway pseudopilin PulG